MYFGGKSAPRVLLPRAAAAPPEQSPDREVDVAADRGPAARPHVEGPRDVRRRGLLRGPGPEHGRGVGSVAVTPSPRCSDASKSRVMELINDPMGCPFGPNAIYYEDGTIEAIKYIPAFDFREPWKSEILCSYGDSYWRDNIIYSIVIGQGMSRLL